MLQVFGTPLSSPTNKVRFVLNFLNVPFDFKMLNLLQGEQMKPEFLAINPFGKVPAIKDGDFCLAESNAIVRFIAEKHESSLFPKNVQQRAVVDQWIEFATQHVAAATSKVFFNTCLFKFLENFEADTRSEKESREFLQRFFPIVDKQLAKQDFIADTQLSLADFALLSAVDVCEISKIDLTPFANITRWQKELMQQKFYTDCHVSYTDTFKKLLVE